jgi:hypothetical protein
LPVRAAGVLFFSILFGILAGLSACGSTGDRRPEEEPSRPGQAFEEDRVPGEEEIPWEGAPEEDPGPGIEEEWAFPGETENLPVSGFDEVWAYLVQGREDALREGLPISDLGYFGAEVDSYGKLTGVPRPRDIPPFKGRVHLVVKCDGYSLTHFVLKRDSPERRELIADLLGETRNFDGLQIDFEYIPVRDREQFFSFLEELRAGLKNKFFTVALKARTRALDNDVHDYTRISPLVDRILIMAYDEHWGGSAPGPIAGMDWCRNVAAYALSVIGREKLIMGLPFYGRAWTDPSPAKAYTYPQIANLLNESGVLEVQREKGIPNFEYETSVSVRAYYEDAASLAFRLRMYSDMAVRAVGFWRLGQENPGVWDVLELGGAQGPQ